MIWAVKNRILQPASGEAWEILALKILRTIQYIFPDNHPNSRAKQDL